MKGVMNGHYGSYTVTSISGRCCNIRCFERRVAMTFSTQYAEVFIVMTDGCHDYDPKFFGVYTGLNLAMQRLSTIADHLLPNVLDKSEKLVMFRPTIYTAAAYILPVTINKALEMEIFE